MQLSPQEMAHLQELVERPSEVVFISGFHYDNKPVWEAATKLSCYNDDSPTRQFMLFGDRLCPDCKICLDRRTVYSWTRRRQGVAHIWWCKCGYTYAKVRHPHSGYDTSQ